MAAFYSTTKSQRQGREKTYLLHYLLLALILLSGLFLLLMCQGRAEIQLLLGIGMALSYFVWGIVHHFLMGDLHRKHVVEYALITILGIVLLAMIFR